MWLTGHPGAAPTAPAAPVANRVRSLVEEIELVCGPLDEAQLLTGRAAEAGWSRRGHTSVNGFARLLQASDGWFAVNLSRPADVELLPAAISGPVDADEPEIALERWARDRRTEPVVSRLQLLGIPAAVLGGAATLPAVNRRSLGPRCTSSRSGAPLKVIDFSALWAGPLAAHLLGRAGGEVLTIEDTRRPDKARTGPLTFFRNLHSGREHQSIDFAAERWKLADLIADADVVIEASRPRALRQLGLFAEDWLAARSGRSWLSITGYGRNAYGGSRVAFGDDAAAAGGLVAYDNAGRPVFCADAIADPLTGLRACAEVVRSQAEGGGHLIDIAMAGVCAEIAGTTTTPIHRHRISLLNGTWWVSHEDRAPVQVMECS